MRRNPTRFAINLALIISILTTASLLPTSRSTAARDSAPSEAASWNMKSAAGYLDKRNTWWIHNMGAIDHGTACISCHTAFPYALARPTLRSLLNEKEPCETERLLQDSIVKRVRNASEMQPFLNAPAQSRGAESVLNALVLARNESKRAALSDDMRRALDTMWERQIKSGDKAGAWAWFGDGGGGEEPWEAFDSQYWGATLAAVAVGTLPANYRAAPEVRDRVSMLMTYLRSGEVGQSLHNRLSLLWAAEKLPGLLGPEQQKSIVDDLRKRQHADGGWSASDLAASGWKRFDSSAQETKSDGFATGLTAFILRQTSSSGAQAAAKKARSWLVQNQDASTGAWPASSWNKKRDPASDVGKFMTDAGTAFAVLALTGGD